MAESNDFVVEPEKESSSPLEWEKVTYAFPILKQDMCLQSECSDEEYLEIQKLIVRDRLQIKVRSRILIKFEQYFRRTVVPSFWSNFIEIDDDAKGFQLFKTAVVSLHQTIMSCSALLDRLELLHQTTADKKGFYGERDLKKGINVLLRGTLLSQLPTHYHVITRCYLNLALNVFDNESNINSRDPICSGCNSDSAACNCTYIVKVFHDVNRKLLELNINECLLGQVLTELIKKHIETHIVKVCSGSFDVSHLEPLEMWLDSTVLGWIAKIYCIGSTHRDNDEKYQLIKTSFKHKLTYLAYLSYTNLRIDELLKIIIEYPDSQAAVNDLKICLTKTNLRPLLCKKLQNGLETRLLHPGVNTPDILTAYVSTIRALRHLDPSGTILEIVTQPVRNYLRNREDTIRSVVSSFTEEGSSNELAEELVNFAMDAEPVVKNEPWADWKPDPIDADPKTYIDNKKDSDIISMLINIYGSKELFVNEYRTLLADRLLAQSEINSEKENKYLGLLKLRFGESQLHYCEVMLKDIVDSSKLNEAVNHDKSFTASNDDFDCRAMILSAQFWPPFKDESLELPEKVKTHLEAYTKSFEALKGNRTLSWKQHLGNVDIEIEIGDRKLDLTVSPFNATLIMYFENKPEWVLDDLQQVMKVPITILRRKIAYWQSMGIIIERQPDYFVLNEGTEAKTNISTNQVQEMICDDDEAESAMASAHDQREGELQVFWSYIVGMLTNLDSLPLDRIHQMLKMFASQAPGTECSLQELRQFLDTKVRSHQLVLQGGLYKLPKN